MATGLAMAALRAHRPAFVGTAVAALFAASVVSAATTMLSVTGTKGLSPEARRVITENSVDTMAAVLLIGSVYLTVFVVVSTMGTAVAQQHREFALVRAIGARPPQIRRAVVAQAVAAALPSAAAGFGLGCVVARLWFDDMAEHGLIPAGVSFRLSWAGLPVSLGVAVVTSAIAAQIASLRFSLLRPAKALREAATGRRRLGLLRAPLGVLAVAGGAVLCALLAREPSGEESAAAFLVLLLFCAGVGLLGPRIVGPAAWLASGPVRPFGSSARLAMLNVRSQTRRFSAAVVPLVLVVSFGTTKIALHTTAEHRTGSAGSAGEVWLDYVGTGLYASFAAIAAANTLAMVSFERRREVALLRVIGMLPGQLRAMAAWEAAVVALTALLLGAAIALATLAPILGAAYGNPMPYVPWNVAAGVAGGTLLLALLATGLPVQSALRERAITRIEAA
ncbi:FtsX-like permease family protein [Streptomyces sp. 7N604]|uniref:FtsX-like permease family protein n=1 Tax=Streptomyces sp. 7N604 TaxID=3457415 RepID=UPI003FCFD516